MSDYHCGVRVVEINDGTRTLSTVSTAIVGLVCNAEDADATSFPLNTPVLLTNVLASIAQQLQLQLQNARKHSGDDRLAGPD
ncbi:hypothetical protein HA38_22840 [Pantoea allii]|nr:hypothetical protein HA38_22840 [Pantoea allii]